MKNVSYGRTGHKYVVQAIFKAYKYTAFKPYNKSIHYIIYSFMGFSSGPSDAFMFMQLHNNKLKEMFWAMRFLYDIKYMFVVRDKIDDVINKRELNLIISF